VVRQACATDPADSKIAVPCPDTRPRASDAFPTAPFLKRARPSLHRRTPQTVVMAECHYPTDTDTDTPPHTPSYPPNGSDSACAIKPTPTSIPLGSTLQLQLRLDDDDDDNDHDGDDEQEYDDDPMHSISLSRSTSHSPLPHAPFPPAPHQQQQLQPTPAPTPFGAHVHFHSRVRITSGLRRHSRANPALGGDSSDSDSPSSSISAPLRHRSQDSLSHLPLGQRVSRLAAQALQKRRMTAAVASPTASRRLRARDYEYTPFLRAGVPVTYGAAPRGDDRRSRIGELRGGEDALTFGRWPWRVLNRQVSSGLSCCAVRLWSFRSVVEVANRV
jgi:hypothetical protein